MLSNRTANFKLNDEVKEEIKNTKDSIIIKQFTIPLPKINMKFKFLDEDEKDNSDFSFQNDLLSNRAYKFLKDKDECLSAMILDDSIPITEK